MIHIHEEEKTLMSPICYTQQFLFGDSLIECYLNIVFVSSFSTYWVKLQLKNKLLCM